MPENKSPKISVCIPTFNHGHFLKDAIDSVLAQTYTDFELVVVDNCSTDDTARVVRAYVARDRRIRYVRNPVNVGAQNNLNRCIELASGEYVNILCADDMLEPTALQELVRAFEDHPRVSLAGCARVVVDKDLRPMSALSFSGKFELVPGGEAIRKCLRGGNRIGEPSAVLFRKNDAARGFDARYRQLIDLEMWFHLLRKGDFAFVPELLCRFRRHEESQTRRNMESLSFIPDCQMILDEYVINNEGDGLQHWWKMRIAFNVWALQFRGLSIIEAHRNIRKIYPLALFYLVLPFEALVRVGEIVKDRLAALRLLRMQDGRRRGPSAG